MFTDDGGLHDKTVSSVCSRSLLYRSVNGINEIIKRKGNKSTNFGLWYCSTKLVHRGETPAARIFFDIQSKRYDTLACKNELLLIIFFLNKELKEFIIINSFNF